MFSLLSVSTREHFYRKVILVVREHFLRKVALSICSRAFSLTSLMRLGTG